MEHEYRTEVLDCYIFDSLQEVGDMTADWLHRYNHHRPHESLGRIPLVEYRVKQFPNLSIGRDQEFEGLRMEQRLGGGYQRRTLQRRLAVWLGRQRIEMLGERQGCVG
jgi:hypothetical protein